MTADAKIGLLLGLFFIVLIAYLINGLPSFLQSAAAEDVVKTTSVVTPSTPDLVIDRQLTETARRLSPDIPLRKTEPPQEVIILNSIPQEAAAPNPVAGDIPIPPAPTPSVISEQINQLDLPSTGRTTTQPAAREHIVQRGENLAVIAQKYYGPEQGNRRAVIQKLYEANKEAMSSPDHVVVGSRLVIPPLTDSAATVRTEPPATESLLERFSNFFERTNSASTTSHAAKPQPKTVQYVVQPGDSLWKIAEKTLGDGNKYKDLLDLNKDRLKSADDLKAGMTLILPAR